MLELHRCLSPDTHAVAAQDYGKVTGKQVVWRLVKIQLARPNSKNPMQWPELPKPSVWRSPFAAFSPVESS